MSNNDLPCSKCKSQHHPADECMPAKAYYSEYGVSIGNSEMTTPEKVYCDRQLCVDQEYAMDGDGGCHKCPAGKESEMTTPEIEPDRVNSANLLRCLACYDTHYYTPAKFDKDVDMIMEHIKSDRARIVDPIVEYKNSCPIWGGLRFHEYIDEAIRRAGRKE